MKRYLAAGAVLAGLAGASAIGQSPRMGPGTTGHWGSPSPWVRMNMARHHRVMMYGIPKPYDAARDPTPNSREKLSRGAAVFAQNCASCHGPTGRGNGPAATNLSPPPANLAWLAHTPMSRSDPYMAWIGSGGWGAFSVSHAVFQGHTVQWRQVGSHRLRSRGFTCGPGGANSQRGQLFGSQRLFLRLLSSITYTPIAPPIAKSK